MTVEKFSKSEVLRCVRSFLRGSVAGGSGLSPPYLLELGEVVTTNDANSRPSTTATLATRLARGKIDAIVAPCLSGPRATPLREPEEGVRPVAVGEILCPLVSSMVMLRVN